MCTPKVPKAAPTVALPPPSVMPDALGSAYEDNTPTNSGVAMLRVASRSPASRLSIRGRDAAPAPSTGL